MAPPRQVLRQQLEILIDFVEENKELLKGATAGSTITQQYVRQKWAGIAKRLNAVESGALKTPQRWRKVSLCDNQRAVKYLILDDNIPPFLLVCSSSVSCIVRPLKTTCYHHVVSK